MSITSIKRPQVQPDNNFSEGQENVWFEHKSIYS
jgi:hypothetical protein